MIIDNSILLQGYLDTVDKTINYFTAEFTNPAEFREIKELAISTIKKSGNKTEESFIQSGYLSTYDFLIYLGIKKLLGEKGVRAEIVDLTLKALADNFIISPLNSLVVKQSVQMRFKANLYSAVLNKMNLTHNVIFGFGFIAERYRNSVFKIEQVDKLDEVSIGTGFLVLANNNKQYVVTNKHVIEAHKKLRLLDVDDNEIEMMGSRLHPLKDLALIELKSGTNATPFLLSIQFEIMSEIITIGYPSIPMTKFSYQVVHRGEVNSLVEDYENNRIFLFSAKTSSGNSGSPVVNKSGMVIGIVTQELFEESAFRQKGKLPYYAAIPSGDIQSFIND